MNAALNVRLLLTLLWVGVAVLGWRYWQGRDRDALTNQPTETTRGYYLTDARMRQTGTSGDARYSVQAKRIEQNVRDQRIYLEQVQLTFNSDSGASWLLTADQGVLDDHQQIAHFNGRVSIRPNELNNPTSLHTEILDVDLVRQQATTREPVQLRMNEHSLTARGLVANLKEQRLRLESQVRGLFQINAENHPAASP